MSADPIHYKSITELSELFRRGELLPSKVTEAMLSRIAKLDSKFYGYALVLAERAMAQAKRCDAELAKGVWRGPLHGVPIGLKDLCYTTFAPTAGGTTIHAKFVPSFNATIVDRLEHAGAVTLGKLKMTEGAYTSHHPNDQAPLNPWGVDYWVGSSSSGSGVATSVGLCFGSIGSDTGGSIRFPSATCGLTGIKPTWGRVSRHGVFPLADSLDHVGPMCRSAAARGGHARRHRRCRCQRPHGPAGAGAELSGRHR
ncbi:Asp-tRNA(Asn)/Glu-tRNA(Gln) amidotransferase A subunit family amidase [Bradyrhizobium sp. LB1.3]